MHRLQGPSYVRPGLHAKDGTVTSKWNQTTPAPGMGGRDAGPAPRGGSRTWRAVAIAAVGLTALVALSQRPAAANTSHSITIFDAANAGAADIDLTGDISFADVMDALDAAKDRTIAIDIPGLDTIENIPMNLTTGPGQSLALTAPADAVSG
jgi:hypothetical protein